MAAYDTIKKVKLKDPESFGSSAAILYPLTGINAIMAGTSGDAATTYITGNGSGNQIQPQYLAIVNSSGFVNNAYISFIDSNGKIDDSYLNFIDMPTSSGGQAKISQDYLPSYVDDVIDVPVVTYPDNADPLAYDLEIQVSIVDGNKVYTFKQWNGSQWVAGGGQTSTIYVAATDSGAGDGSIYRCASNDTTKAIKISENPYVINTSATNGVWLASSGNSLLAKAQLATNAVPGTVVINTAPATATNNVALSVSNGIVSVAALTAGPAQAGIVFAVGTDADYQARSSAYGDAYIVPTAKWMKDTISSSIVGVPLATYTSHGIVQIDINGHIIVSSGIISVPLAGLTTAGVVQIIDTIDTTVTGNASKTVTQGGIVSYVTSALNGYQTTLSGGSGVLISGGYVSVRKAGDALGFDSAGNLIVSAAQTTTLGAVLITGDSSYIENGSSTIDGKPIAVNPVAVKNYVEAYVSEYVPPIPKATTLDSGVVQIQPLADATSTDSSYLVAQSYDVKTAIAGATAAVLEKVTSGLLTSGPGIGFLRNATANPPTLQISVKLDTAASSPLHTNDSERIYIDKATTSGLGVVQIGDGLAVNGGIVSVPTVDEATAFDVSSNASKFATVSAISGFVVSEIEELQQPISPGIAIDIVSGATVDVLYDSMIMSLTSNKLTVKPTTTSGLGVMQVGDGLSVSGGGIVYVHKVTEASEFSVASNAGKFATVAGISSFVSEYTTGYQEQLSDGAATEIVNGNTVDVLYNTDQMSIITSKLTISSATADSLGLVNVPSGSGLIISSGAITLDAATSSHLGGVKTASANTGISVSANGQIQANIDSTVLYFNNNNAIGVSSATTTSGGIVQILDAGSDLDVSSKGGAVPVASAVSAFVSAKVNTAKTTLSQGSGIYVSAATTGSATNYLISAVVATPILFSGGAITIQTASASVDGSFGNQTLGAVYVQGTTVRDDFEGVTNTPSTVPTESAVRAAINAIPYITYEEVIY